MALTGALTGAASGAAMGTSIMPGWGTAIGGVVGGLAGMFTGGADDEASSGQRKAQKRMELRQMGAIADIEASTDDYFKRLDDLDSSFDPYNMEKAYASFYEGVILPMERDFKEFVIPGIHAAYSGGIFGAESYQSGAAKEAELKAQRELATTEAQLKEGARDKAVAVNFQEDSRNRESASSRLQASTIAPNLAFGQATEAYKAEQDTLETQYATSTAKRDALLGLPSTIISGLEAGSSIQEGINRVFGNKQAGSATADKKGVV
jgi:hypothetical protein